MKRKHVVQMRANDHELNMVKGLAGALHLTISETLRLATREASDRRSIHTAGYHYFAPRQQEGGDVQEN